MKTLKAILSTFGLTLGASAFCGPYCIQNSEGLNCRFATAAACEEQKGDHEICVRNPSSTTTQAPNETKQGLCFDGVCLRYTFEHCSIDDLRGEDPPDLNCDVEY